MARSSWARSLPGSQVMSFETSSACVDAMSIIAPRVPSRTGISICRRRVAGSRPAFRAALVNQQAARFDRHAAFWAVDQLDGGTAGLAAFGGHLFDFRALRRRRAVAIDAGLGHEQRRK